MSIRIKNRDPKSTDFASDEIVINRKEGTLFFKSDKSVIKLSGDNLSTETVEGSSTSTSVWTLSGDNIFYPDEVTPIIKIGTNLTPSTQGTFPEVIIDGQLAIRNTDCRVELDDTTGDKFRIQNQNGRFKIIQHSDSVSDNDILAISGSRVGIGTETPTTELDVPGTGSFGRIECLTISSSQGDFDASTIRIGGEPLDRSNLIALKEGRSIQQTARDLGEGDTGKTNIARVEAVMSIDDDSTYTKMTGTGRMGTFISGSLFHDLQKSPTINLARIGDGNTDLLFSGSIVSASINGGSF